ncbi:MAG: DNA-3-methyladenine glycosylase 2 family protein [Ruminococcaceae bacterium]|nr:DNA-3-methyladenine glycosylase 2 family protein [Oscillospiraceae bacterium]
MNITMKGNHLVVETDDYINLDYSLDCGQSFRWKKSENIWQAVAFGKKISIEQKDENTLFFYDTTEDDFEKIWKIYFDFERDYKTILSRFENDSYLYEAIKKYRGIRVLNQEPWEAICSFIISQNNNIPRIKGIIDRLCETFGEDLGDGFYSFPSAEKIAELTAEDLAPLRSGFRAKYILDAAKKVAEKEIDFDSIYINDISYGREELMKIKGVGPKVAECALLYGFKKSDAFPVDVWVKRIMSELYPDGIPACAYPEIGIAQQYLFHWRRNV